MNEHDAELYVGLPDPAAVRKPLLEAARVAVGTGRMQGTLLHLQDQKFAVRTDIARVLKELRDELARLQMILPHRDLKEAPPPPAVKKKVLDSRVDKIAAALAEIEERMKAL
jgi:hypothetical protein